MELTFLLLITVSAQPYKNIHVLFIFLMFFSWSLIFSYKNSLPESEYWGDKQQQVQVLGAIVYQISYLAGHNSERNTLAYVEQNTICVKMIVLLCQTTFYLYKYKQVTGRIQGLCGLGDFSDSKAARAAGRWSPGTHPLWPCRGLLTTTSRRMWHKQMDGTPWG